jgi:hypothetical protein
MSYEDEEVEAAEAQAILHPPVRLPGQKPLSLKEQQKAQHSALSARKKDHRMRYGTPISTETATQVELDLGLAPVIDLHTGVRRKRKEMLPLLQCEGLNQYGLPCNHYMRTTRREGRRVYCHQHEYQRAGWIKLRCKYYDECYNTVRVQGHDNAIAMRHNVICGFHQRHIAGQERMRAEVNGLKREFTQPRPELSSKRAEILAIAQSIPGQPDFTRPKKQ